MARKIVDPETDIRPMVRRLGKPPQDWQREDIVQWCMDEEVRVLNFRYPAGDGKLRELRLPVNDRATLERVLATGERVDGSSLFPGVFDTGESDLYVVPVYRWAFPNPWAIDELDIVCRFAGPDGAPSPLTPDNLLAGAAGRLEASTGAQLFALAELEFYLILDRDEDRFSGVAQRNYHQSAPYLHGRDIADEILRTVSETTGCVKYCHGEVGYIDRMDSSNPELDGKRAEQYELEFDLTPIEDVGTWLTVARWLVRAVAAHHGASVTFLPKLEEGMAGSGLHLHLALLREGRNVMIGDGGDLSDDALRMIGGLLGHAVALTAFGNTVAASYLRLVPGQEAPTYVCWGRHNRSSLVRVPLNFVTEHRLDQSMNPGETGPYPEAGGSATVEYRSPDGSAFIHLLLAATTMAIQAGLDEPEGLATARKLEISGNLAGQPEIRSALEALPATAVAAARVLRKHREFFESHGFPARLIDLVIRKLQVEADEGLSARLRKLPATERLVASRSLMHKDLHKH